jgi:hypothetical protein
MLVLRLIVIIVFSLGLPQHSVATTIPFDTLNDWEAMVTPKTQVTTNYTVKQNQLHIESRHAHSGLIWSQKMNVHTMPQLSFSWKVSKIMPSANISIKSLDDAPIRILILFTEDDHRKSWIRRQLDKLFLQFYGKLPYDYSLAYVWANRHHDSAYIEGAYTHKLRSIILDEGDRYVGQWRSHTLNIYDDFKRIYGAEPPKIATLGILSDTDNTKGNVLAWVKDLTLY